MTAAPRTRLALADDHPDTCAQYVVTLNGAVQTRCTVADAEKGYVIRYKFNLFGLPIKGRNGQPVTETIKGVVTITPKGAA